MIFISGRFRSGTTLLWDLLRQIPDVCAYYEPFHDNLIDYIKANQSPDPTHKGVRDYYAEYQPILPKLIEVHKRAFGVSRLCLSSKDNYPELSKYIELLADSCSDRIPLFKFVRADFRLPWLRHVFPDAKIIYIKRNPRNNWLSIVSKTPKEQREEDWLNTGFDLVIWSANLAPHFPALGVDTGHSYARHYLLWRLSTAVGERYADLVIDYDQDLLINPTATIRQLLDVCGLSQGDEKLLAERVLKERTQNWETMSDKVPFLAIEQACEEKLSSSGLLEHIASGGLDTVGWPVYAPTRDSMTIIEKLCIEVSEHRRLVPQFGALSREMESERTARATEQAEAVKQITALDLKLTAYTSHWIFNILKHPQSL